MARSTTTNKIAHTGNGVTKTFPYDFPMTYPAYAVVTVTDLSGVESTKVLNTDFTITVSANSGDVTFVTAPENGFKVTIKRVVPLIQKSDWQNGGAVDQELFEKVADNLTDIAVQLQEQLDRTPKFMVSSSFAGIEFPELVANKAIKVSADGAKLVCSTNDFDSIVQDAQAVLAQTQAEHAATVADANAILATTEAARDVATAQAGVATTQATNSTNSAALANQWATSLALVDGVNFGAKKYAQDAAGYAAALNLPGLVAGDATKMLRVSTTEDGYELRTASQVLADIGAASAGHAHTGVYEPANANIAKINVAQTFTTSQRGSITALVDGVTITPDFSLTNDFTVTLSGNRTIANPSNMAAGQKGVIVVRQDATGSRTVAWGSYFKWSGGVAPTLSSAANAVDRIQYHVVSATEIHCVWIGDFK